jgi:hypothetical protein
MAIGTAELKLSFDVFSKLLSWASKKRNNKELESLKSQAFQELLKGSASRPTEV